MKTRTLNEQATIREAIAVLLDHLEPAKVAQFLAAQPIAGGDYLRERDALFTAETVDSLCASIARHQATRSKTRRKRR